MTEAAVMSDIISGIKPVIPSYPVRPVQPAQKDREPGEKKRKDRGRQESTDRQDDNGPTIDEHV